LFKRRQNNGKNKAPRGMDAQTATQHLGKSGCSGGTFGTSMELFFDPEPLIYNNNLKKQVKVPAFFQLFHLMYIIFFYK